MIDATLAVLELMLPVAPVILAMVLAYLWGE